MLEREDYSFLFDPPKDSDVFTRTLYYPRSPSSPTESRVAAPRPRKEESPAPALAQDPIATTSLGENRHAATLSKFTAGVFSSNLAALETVAPFLSSHIHDQVHIPDGRQKNNSDNGKNKVYCYRHQPDLRCQRRTPQEDTMADIQKVFLPRDRVDEDNGRTTIE
jgi:hypothetical protein